TEGTSRSRSCPVCRGISLAPPIPFSEPASVPALSAESVSADLRWSRDLRRGPPPLVRGQSAPLEHHALPRPRHDAPPLQGQGLWLSPRAAPARCAPVRLRIDDRARGRLCLLLLHPLDDPSPVARRGLSG